MVNLKQTKTKSGVLITAYTDNNNILQQWKKQYPKGVMVQNTNSKGIRLQIDKKKIKDANELNEYLTPLYNIAEENGEPFNKNEMQNINNNNENFMEKYDTLNQKFQAHLGNMMKTLLDKGKINDKIAQELIMGKVPGGNIVYGLNYGGTNPLFILFQDKNATYVASEHQWKTYFNRYVDFNGEEKPIPIYVKTNVDNGIDVDKALDVLGVSSTKELNKHQKSALHKNLSNVDTKGEKLGNKIVYDVRFTKVIDGMEDIFTNQAGLSSNVYGTENQAAKDKRREEGDVRNNKIDNTYDDTQYRTINAQNINDIRQSSKVMTSNINYFLRMNKWEELSNSTNFRQALKNLLEYEVNRDTNVVDKETTKEVAYAFLSNYFNIWQDKSVPTQLPKGTGFNTKLEYRACFYVIRQSCDVILGRNFGLRGVTREEVEQIPNPQPINNIKEPTLDDFLNFMGVDKHELAKHKDNEPLNNNTNNEINDENIDMDKIKEIKENFYKWFNKLI